MDRRQRRVLVALLVVVASLAVPAAATAQTTQARPETDNTVTRIQLYENGSARWSIQVRTRLETDEEVDQYRSFQSRLRENRSAALERFRARMTGVVSAAANATDRPMAARSFALSTHIQEVPQRWGIVTFAFTWTNFARQDGAALVVGDVFEGGFFLAENDRLIVVEPPGYRVTSRAPTPDSKLAQAVAWDGRRDFADRHPRVRFEPESTPAGASPTARRGRTTLAATQDTTSGAGGLSTGPLAGLAVIGIVVLGGLSVAAHRRGWAGFGGNAAAGPVTDADRVRALLDARGGQLKQTEIDDAVDWSSSKTSRVLSRMAEEGTVEKLRIGRENVIRLADEGPENE